MKFNTILIAVFLFLMVFLPTQSTAASFSEPLSIKAIYKHVNQIAQNPHPTGSIENKKVREYIVEELTRTGLKPTIQTEEITTTNKGRSTFIITTTVHNVIVKLSGTEGKKAVVIMAHYDSVPFGPGANDDGVAVASMLEMAKNLKEKDFKNDVIFLFTDAEELGMLGAKVFWERHPLAKDVGMVMNLESRGSKGPMTMFQTSRQNGWLIEEFSKVAPNPVASSLTGDFYKLMPNDSDLTIPINKGVPGINLAYGEGWTDYHSEMDNPDQLNRPTVKHVSNTIYELTNHFSQQDLTTIKKTDKIYFSFLGKVVHYSKDLMYIFTAAITILFMICIIRALKMKVLEWKKLLFGFLGIFVTMVLVGAVNFSLWLLIKSTWANDVKVWDTVYHANYFLIAFISLTVLLSIVLYQYLFKKVARNELFVGGLIWWALLLIITTIFLPGATYLFAWPLLIMLLSILLIRSKGLSFSMTIISVATIVLLYIPFYKMLFTWMQISMVVPMLATMVLLFISILPVIEVLTKRRIKLILLSITALLFIFTAVNSNPNENLPLDSNLFYSVNSNTKQAYWISKTELNEWTQQFFSDGTTQNLDDFIPNRGFISNVLVNEAPYINYPSPNLQIITNEIQGSTRRIKLKAAEGTSARSFMLEFKEGEVLEAFINGKEIVASLGDENLGKWRLTYYGVSNKGFDLEVVLKNSNPVTIKVTDWYDALPSFVNTMYSPKPDSLTSRLEYSDSTLVTKEIEL
ncbi:peptidase M28-like protein [Ureibacillus xyleni]|uniref:Peptidase M28-like protein n=1 Tax=Ureibacillus xyleni TaxID=614648 RepID=A0A285T2H8_9BACL|nr:M20/M25/M40 family metallo-hydrolase [Ureibacillus xyleni]SOC15497.1 peptidase M28-like protein [Ureibacillus xyleni]